MPARKRRRIEDSDTTLDLIRDDAEVMRDGDGWEDDLLKVIEAPQTQMPTIVRKIFSRR